MSLYLNHNSILCHTGQYHNHLKIIIIRISNGCVNVMNTLFDLDAWFARLVDFRDVFSVWGEYEPCMGSNLKWSNRWLICYASISKSLWFLKIYFWYLARANILTLWNSKSSPNITEEARLLCFFQCCHLKW